MLGSVRGVVSNDHSYRDKDQTSQGPRVFTRSKATCAAPLCEVLTPCRGLRPHHVQKDRIGTWEISCLAAAAKRLKEALVIVVRQVKAELVLQKVVGVPHLALIAAFCGFIDHARVVRIVVIARKA